MRIRADIKDLENILGDNTLTFYERNEIIMNVKNNLKSMFYLD